MLVTLPFQRVVAQPSVGVDDATRFDRLLYKGNQALGGSIDNLAHPNPPDSRPILLRSNNNQGLFQVQPTRKSFLQAADITFVHLHSAGKSVACRPHHGASQLMQPRPGRLVALQSEHPLQTQCAGTALLRRHPPHGAEPDWQWGSRALEDRPGCHRSLAATVRAFEQNSPHRPRSASAAPWATETLRPAQPEQIR